MPRPRKPKPTPEAVILPELDDDEDEGSVIPDDDGWITLQSPPAEKEPKRVKGEGKPARRGGKHGSRE